MVRVICKIECLESFKETYFFRAAILGEIQFGSDIRTTIHKNIFDAFKLLRNVLCQSDMQL